MRRLPNPKSARPVIRTTGQTTSYGTQDAVDGVIRQTPFVLPRLVVLVRSATKRERNEWTNWLRRNQAAESFGEFSGRETSSFDVIAPRPVLDTLVWESFVVSWHFGTSERIRQMGNGSGESKPQNGYTPGDTQVSSGKAAREAYTALERDKKQ